MTSEVEALILRKNSTRIRFDNRMANTVNESFFVTIKIHKRPINTAITDPMKKNP